MSKVLKITWEEYKNYPDCIKLDDLNKLPPESFNEQREHEVVNAGQKAIYYACVRKISDTETHFFLSYPAKGNKGMDKGTLCIIAKDKIEDENSIKMIVFLARSRITPAKSFEIIELKQCKEVKQSR